jgi:bacterioferritin (cytochrome b1)
LINRWRKTLDISKVNSQDQSSLDVLKRIKKDAEVKKIEYLEAQVVYLKAENSFLAKLPKKKKN